MPNVFIIIDNYDTVKESPFVEDYEEMMAKVTREGLALGVYIILTGSDQAPLNHLYLLILRRALHYTYLKIMN